MRRRASIGIRLLGRSLPLRTLVGTLVALASFALRGATNEQPTVIVVVGAPGEKAFEQVFEDSARQWSNACQKAAAHFVGIGLEPSATNELEQLQGVLNAEPKKSDAELWLVLIGHGTFAEQEAKFNLRGPDLSATNLVELLQPFQRPLAIIDTSSASSPFLTKLAAPDRVVVSATRSGYEQNYARFGKYFTAAITDPSADLDKDGQVSILEAYLKAAHDTAEFYKSQARLATEHPLLDDNGDGLGTPPDWFHGVRAVKKSASGAALDGLRAHQWELIPSEAERKLSPALRAERNEIELSISQLRDAKETLPVDEYYDQLEVLLLKMARLYEQSDKSQ